MTVRKSKSKSDTLPRAVRKAKRIDRARKLLGKGQTYEQLGEALKIAPSGIDRLISEMQDVIPPTREAMRRRESLRLELMSETLMDQVEPGCDLAIIDEMLKISAMQRKLMNLDRPKGQADTRPANALSDKEFMRSLAKIAEGLTPPEKKPEQAKKEAPLVNVAQKES